MYNYVLYVLVVHMQALNFTLEGAQQFSPGKGHFYEENVNLYRATTVTAVGAVG